jgi:hypothetical protein
MRALASVAALLAVTHVATLARAGEPGPYVRLSVPRTPGTPELQRRAVGDDGWSSVCESPCDLTLGTGYEYRIGGRGVVDSDSFRLPRMSRLSIHADTGSTMLRDIGTGFVVWGFVFAAAGGALLLLPRDPHDSPSSRAFVGWTFVGVGLFTVGLGMFLREKSQTHVTMAPLEDDDVVRLRP